MFNPGNLVLYKNRPARLLHAGDRLEIELDNGETLRVRSKDVALLHAGPLASFTELRSEQGEVEAAWEMLAGEKNSLADVAELIYGTFTPSTAWAAWQLVADGLYFDGVPEEVYARTPEEVAKKKKDRAQAEASQLAWKTFLERTRRGVFDPADRAYLRDVEGLALGRGERSVVLRELGRGETPENAHALLLELGVWNEQTNPYPARFGAPLTQPDLPVPDILDEPRRDLTHLPALAIDDAGTDTPDDAISYEPLADGCRIWVHVADVAALVQPNDALDLEARARVESLYLPEGTIRLLPWAVTQKLGLGLQPVSPALSFGMTLDAAGTVTHFEVTPSLIQVTRLTYEAAEKRIEEAPLCQLERVTGILRARRRANGAVMIHFPEVKFAVEDGAVSIEPLPELRSRTIVEEAMILAGAEAANFAQRNGIRLAFSQQEPPETTDRPETLSGMFALRRLLKRGQYRTIPGGHSGLGVAAYTQVTSPLRRYLDLVGHQQLRAFLRGAPQLTEAELLERIGAAEAMIGALRQSEGYSERHWTMVYLMQHPGWQGDGLLVEKRGAMGLVLIPDLALETRLHMPQEIPLDAPIHLKLSRVTLPTRDASFVIQ